LLLGCPAEAPRSGVTLRFVTWKPAQPPAWDAAIRRFEEAHPEIRIEREIGPASSTAFHDRLTQKLKNRDASVDVYLMDVIWAAEFAAAGWARRLDDRFSAEERARFLPGTIRAATWSEHVWAVPAFIDAGVLYYRKDLLEKHGLDVPKTWEELARDAQTIVEAERANEPDLVGYSAQFKQYEGLVCNMLEFAASNGGALTDDAARRPMLAEPRTIASIRWVRDQLIGRLAPRSTLTYQEPESLALFVQGKAVFHRNWPYAWELANDPAESRVAGRVGMAPLPHFAGGSSASALGGWFYGISALSPHAEEAWSFVAFMTSPEVQKHFVREAGLSPTRRDVYDDSELRAASPVLAELAPIVRAAVPRPVTPIYPALSETLQRFFSAAIVRPDSRIEDLAASAAAEIAGYLELAQRGAEP
jgi:multiple sugar transport system substrate-binding protein